LDVAGGETDGEDWLGWVDGLGEDVGAQGEAADVFEHGWLAGGEETRRGKKKISGTSPFFQAQESQRNEIERE